MVIYTLPETKMAPENGWLEDEFPFGMPYLQGRTVSLSHDIGGAMEGCSISPTNWGVAAFLVPPESSKNHSGGTYS